MYDAACAGTHHRTVIAKVGMFIIANILDKGRELTEKSYRFYKFLDGCHPFAYLENGVSSGIREYIFAISTTVILSCIFTFIIFGRKDLK